MGLAIKLVDCFISCVNCKGILENGQTLPKQLACEHAKDTTFLLCESWGNCIELSYTHYSVCAHDLAQLTTSEFYCFLLIYGNHYVNVPAEISSSLAPNIEKHCTSQCCFM